MRYRVSHRTAYEYSEPVQLSHHAAHLRPRPVNNQVLGEYSLAVGPDPEVIRHDRVDYFGNPVTFFTIQTAHGRLDVESVFEVEVTPQAALPHLDSSAWDQLSRMQAPPGEQVSDFRYPSPQVPYLAEAVNYATPVFTPGRPLVEAVLDLTARIHADFTFDPSATSVGTPLQAVFHERRGVCQDFAHLAIACLRAKGLAARYVSGYIRTIAPAGQEKLEGADASHAWLSVHVPGWGWLDVDPTNNVVAGTDHVTVAWGRDYDDVSPLRGVVLGGGDHAAHVAVDVVEI
jgi:transglutaminase-like putative cysteine protease